MLCLAHISYIVANEKFIDKINLFLKFIFCHKK